MEKFLCLISLNNDTLFPLPSDYEVVTLTLGIVELDDGNRITGQLKIKNPWIDMKVEGKIEVVRKDEFKKHSGIVFYQA